MEDTIFTKVFVGGLAWETNKVSLRSYFEQFGDIVEAVVITDKSSGRSKGYGFVSVSSRIVVYSEILGFKAHGFCFFFFFKVTFCDPEAAQKACIDPAPVIDGRRANCNLAAFGVQRSKPSSPIHGIYSFLYVLIDLWKTLTRILWVYRILSLLKRKAVTVCRESPRYIFFRCYVKTSRTKINVLLHCLEGICFILIPKLIEPAGWKAIFMPFTSNSLLKSLYPKNIMLCINFVK